MASPGPPHSAWLHCQHQAGRAIKQLAPFINLTSTINARGGVKVGEKGGERERREVEGTGTWRGAMMFFLNDCFLLFKSAVNGADLGVINNMMSSDD